MKRTKNQNSFMYNGMTNLKHITFKTKKYVRLLKFTQILRGLHSFVCFPFKSMVFFRHRRLFRVENIEMNANF